MSCLFLDSPSTIRITRLDSCGTPVAGVDDGFVFECFSSLNMTANNDEQDDKTYRNAAGKICAYKKGCVSLLNYEVVLSLQSISPEIVDIMTGSPLVLDFSGEPTGWDDCSSTACTNGFGMEIWVPIIGPCTTGTPESMVITLPWIQNARIGDLELGADAIELEITGNTRAGGNWGLGPWSDVVLNGPAPGTPGKMLTPLGASCHRRIQKTTLPAPTAGCDYVTVPAP